MYSFIYGEIDFNRGFRFVVTFLKIQMKLDDICVISNALKENTIQACVGVESFYSTIP